MQPMKGDDDVSSHIALILHLILNDNITFFSTVVCYGRIEKNSLKHLMRLTSKPGCLSSEALVSRRVRPFAGLLPLAVVAFLPADAASARAAFLSRC